MRSLMRENESERAKSAVEGGGGGEGLGGGDCGIEGAQANNFK